MAMPSEGHAFDLIVILIQSLVANAQLRFRLDYDFILNERSDFDLIRFQQGFQMMPTGNAIRKLTFLIPTGNSNDAIRKYR